MAGPRPRSGSSSADSRLFPEVPIRTRAMFGHRSHRTADLSRRIPGALWTSRADLAGKVDSSAQSLFAVPTSTGLEDVLATHRPQTDLHSGRMLTKDV